MIDRLSQPRHRLMRRFAFGAFALMLGCFSLASAAAKVLRFHAPTYLALDVEVLSDIIEGETGIRLRPDASVFAGDDPLGSILDGSADLAIIDNTRPFIDGVRTVLPLYRGVMHVAVRDNVDLEDIRSGRRRARVEVVNDAPAAIRVLDLFFARFADAPLRYDHWRADVGGLPDFIVYVGPISPNNTEWFRTGFTLLPVGRDENAAAQFYIDGIHFLVPALEPIRIPARTYALPGNETAIDALAVDVLLVTGADTPLADIYALTKTLLEQKARFVAQEPALFRGLSTDFSDANFTFPLHRGVRAYRERNEPGFLERYAEMLNFLVYLTVLAVTGLVAMGRWRARRRKDRIDEFYTRVRALREKLAAGDTKRCLRELTEIEDEAFTALVEERLSADESFRIFTDLVNALRQEIRLRDQQAS